MKFISSELYRKSAAARTICAREWNLHEKSDAYSFFRLFMQSYIDYHNNIRTLRPEQIECFRKLLSERKELVSNDILWDDFVDWKGLTGKYKNKIMYNNRDKSKTIVILNNHVTWYEALYGGFADNVVDLHILKFANVTVKDYNFISITEDLTRVNDNCMMYPSYFMQGVSDTLPDISSIIDEIKMLTPADEFFVYSSCKNTMASSVLAGELGASKLYIQHGASSFVDNDKFTEYSDYEFLDTNGNVILEQIMENIYFTTYIREQYFKTKDVFVGIDDIFDISRKYRKMKILYGYSKNFDDLEFMDYWYKHAKSKSYKNISFEEFEHGEGEEDLTNHWRLAKSFFANS